MTLTRTLAAIALGVLLATSASAQQQGMTMPMPIKDYDDPGGGGDPNPPTGCQGAQNVVRISGFSFSPATVNIQAGQSVCWTWDTSSPHTVTADSDTFNSGPPASAGTFQVTFSTAGTFGYFCQVHGSKTSGMRGSVVVTGDPGGGDPGGGDDGPGKIQLSASAYSIVEGSSVTTTGPAGKKPASGGKVTITVARVGGSHGAASVLVGETKGTAKPGTDFLLPKTNVLKWKDGDDDPKTIQIPLVNDKTPEKDETFTVSLSKATGATLGTPTKAKVTIKDDDKRSALAEAPSDLRATGTGDGVELVWGDGTARGVALHVERSGEAGDDFREIAALPIEATSFVDRGLGADSTFLYRLRAEGPEGESESTAVVAAATDGSRGGCGDSGVCLDGRFEAMASWRRSPGEPARDAEALALPERPRSGLFAFGGRDDSQLVVSVLDGCAVNGHFWVDLAGTTALELEVRVRDTVTGRTWVHHAAGDGEGASVRDIDAFATCR